MAAPGFQRLSFSILSRIEPTATMIEITPARPESTFQYPQSDRAHCNTYALSLNVEAVSPFSILSRIEPTATLLAV